MKRFFNFKLYLEGLKKIRLVGIISGIIILLANTAVPIAVIVQNTPESDGITSINLTNFSMPMFLVLFLTPLFFLSMYSFLNRRNESDFYHAIPYTRSCVLFSFLAAIFTWIWGIILLSTLLTALLWVVCPVTTISFSVLPTIFFVYAAATLYIGSFILLAMTLTGTASSNIAIACVLLFWVRIIGTMLSITLEEIIPIFDLAYSPLQFLSMQYWLPGAIISSFYNTTVFSNVFLWIYSGIILIALYSLSIYLYCTRKSENAGKSAPSKVLQHVYRCVFTLPFILMATMAILFDGPSVFVILLILALAIYFLYELITTKSIKSMLRSTPYLLILVLCGGIFAGGCYLTRETILEGEYSAEDIEAVRFYEYSSVLSVLDQESNTYENLATSEITISDPKASELTAKVLSESIKQVKENRAFYYHNGNRAQYVEITLKSGRKIGRKLYFNSTDYKALLETMQNSETYRQALIQIPKIDEVSYVCSEHLEYASTAETLQLYRLFTEEYNALTDEEKLAFKLSYARSSFDYRAEQNVTTTDTETLSQYIVITVKGTDGLHSFFSTYAIPEQFTKTRAYYLQLMKPQLEHAKKELQEFANGKYDSLMNEMNSDSFYSLNLDLTFVTPEFAHSLSFYDNSYKEFSELFAYENHKKLVATLLPYLTDTPTDSSYCTSSLHIQSEEEALYHNVLFGIRALTPQETETLKQEWDRILSTEPQKMYTLLKRLTNGEQADWELNVRWPEKEFELSFQDTQYGARDTLQVILQHISLLEIGDIQTETYQISLYDYNGNSYTSSYAWGMTEEEWSSFLKIANRVSN